MSGTVKPYHHGSLRSAVISAALDEVSAVGAAALSMREVARRAGVSHAAPLHHFGDKAGLFTAIATEGFTSAAAAIDSRAVGPFGFLDGGIAYVEWALTHPAHFEVMYRPGLYRDGDAALTAAKTAAFDVLDSSAAALAAEWQLDDVAGLVLAGWSLAHGLATLVLAGNLDQRYELDPAQLRAHLERGLMSLGSVTHLRATEPTG